MLRAARPRGGLGGGAQSLLLGFPEKPPGLEMPLKVPAEQHQRAARKEGSFLHCCLAFGKQIFVCVAGGRLFFFFFISFSFFSRYLRDFCWKKWGENVLSLLLFRDLTWLHLCLLCQWISRALRGRVSTQ